MENFADKLINNIKKTNSYITLGIDPVYEKLPNEIVNSKEVLLSPERYKKLYAIRKFCMELIDIAEGSIPAVKPQSAYFEILGPAGAELYNDIANYAKKKGLLVINDVKRGDISSTATAYANAYMSNNSYFSDAITVNPLFGIDGILPFIEIAKKYNKGIFILLKTSNPGSADIQDVICENKLSVYENMANLINEWTSELHGKNNYSLAGVVVGATFPAIGAKLRKILKNTMFLVPGIGVQGGDLSLLKNFLNEDKQGAIFAIARSIIYAFKNDSHTDWKQAVADKINEYNSLINSAV